MKQKRHVSLLFCACACASAVTSSCSSESFAPPPAGTASQTSAALAFEMRSAERTLEDCIAGAPECTYVRFDHPNVIDPPPELAEGARAVTDAVQTFLSQPLRPDEPSATPRELFDRFLTEAGEAEDEAPWFLERKAFILRSTPRIVSLGLAERSFLGGAHGLQTFRFENFDVTTGEKLSLTDVIPDTKREALRLLAERAFRRARGLEPDADLVEAGFQFEEERFTLTENFALEEDALSFYYNPLEIAPYSHGPTEVRLAYDELEGLLTPLVTDDR